MRKWVPAFLIAVSFAVSAAVYGRLDSSLVFPADTLFPAGLGHDGWAVPRLFGAFGFPAVALAIWALLFEAPVGPLGRMGARLFKTADPVRYEVFAPTYRLIVLWIVCFILSFHVALLGHALGWPINGGRLVGITVGLGLILVGNAFPRLRPNPIAGLRTARTMADPLLWARVHRAFGLVWVIAGVLTTAAAVIAPRWALATGVAALALSLVGGVLITRSMSPGMLALIVLVCVA